MQRGRCACSRTPWRVTLPKLWGLRVQSAANVVSASSPAKRRALSGRICWPVPADRKQQLVPDVFYIPWKLVKCRPSTTLRTGWDLATALDVFLGKIDHHGRLQHAAALGLKLAVITLKSSTFLPIAQEGGSNYGDPCFACNSSPAFGPTYSSTSTVPKAQAAAGSYGHGHAESGCCTSTGTE